VMLASLRAFMKTCTRAISRIRSGLPRVSCNIKSGSPRDLIWLERFDHVWLATRRLFDLCSSPPCRAGRARAQDTASMSKYLHLCIATSDDALPCYTHGLGTRNPLGAHLVDELNALENALQISVARALLLGHGL